MLTSPSVVENVLSRNVSPVSSGGWPTSKTSQRFFFSLIPVGVDRLFCLLGLALRATPAVADHLGGVAVDDRLDCARRESLFRREVAGRVDLAELVLRAFVDVRRDVDEALVGRQVDLRLADAHVDVAFLEEDLLDHVAVGLEVRFVERPRVGQPGDDPRLLRLHVPTDLPVGDVLVARDVDALHHDLAVLGDLERELDLIVADLAGDRLDVDEVVPLLDVFIADALDVLVDVGLVQHRERRDVDRFLEAVLVDLLVAGDLHFADRGFLVDDERDVDRVGLAGHRHRVDPHVVDEPRRVDRLDVAVDLPVRELLSGAQLDRRADRRLLHAGQAGDLDRADGPLRGLGTRDLGRLGAGGRNERSSEQCEKNALHATVPSAVSWNRPSTRWSLRGNRCARSCECVTTTSVLPKSAFSWSSEIEHLLCGVRIEISGRLVGEEERRVLDERAGDGDTLLLAARQLAGPVPLACVEADAREQIAGSPSRLVDPEPTDQRGDHHVVERVLVGEEMMELEDEADLPVPERIELDASSS